MNNFCVHGHYFAHDFCLSVDGMNMVTTLIVQNNKHQAIVLSQKIYHLVYHSTFFTLSQQTCHMLHKLHEHGRYLQHVLQSKQM